VLTLLPTGSCAVLACRDTYRALSKQACCKTDVKEQNSTGSHAHITDATVTLKEYYKIKSFSYGMYNFQTQGMTKPQGK